MFTVAQLQTAHSKVKSGADFSTYVSEIKALGVTHYEAYVNNGHILFFGENDHMAKVPEKYEPLTIAPVVHSEEFKAQLVAHQQGKTDYLTFISMCAETGIEKWIVDIEKMTCTYFDTKKNEILTEQIPQ
ncbi:DUF1398 domain-containing protein [Sphingobacterium sp. lm-10]|uniref:DUF1398 domain-containing protein n=1 Tax=Sphingobacterium sp. lm-10 TaxID=2944904 RepID=UPI0020215C82|nr:DUF1398 family protein [Sphingobacterium sp. lm-10]MCL7986445.1 DUF1398 domain-containing protein [Sphingobacterium sp. lm-10]